jgi:hypothetical protein
MLKFLKDGLITEIKNQHPFVEFNTFKTIPGYRALFTKLANFLKEKKGSNVLLKDFLEGTYINVFNR